MQKDKVIGVLLILVSAIIIIAYAYLVFLSEYAISILKLTGFIAVAGVFGILGWIGYTLATTPPPKPIEEIEKEIDEELKKLEQEKTSEQAQEVKMEQQSAQSQAQSSEPQVVDVAEKVESKPAVIEEEKKTHEEKKEHEKKGKSRKK